MQCTDLAPCLGPLQSMMHIFIVILSQYVVMLSQYSRIYILSVVAQSFTVGYILIY